jgi:hypothetical protein
MSFKYRAGGLKVYNANYADNGDRLLNLEKPWTVMGHAHFRAFRTHPEALTWAFERIPQPDPTPQHQEQVTTGWAPKPDMQAAWQEKWELTR